MGTKKKAAKRAPIRAVIEFADVKLHALEILDPVTQENLVAQYGTKFSAKSKLFLDLGIPPERMAVMAPKVNQELKRYPGSLNVTSSALSVLGTVGDFVSLFSRAAGVAIPPGEPK